ncbi:YsnF/AvaK domain-containing protein [Paracoccus luteus]|uniref:YsnF/AvaK domain-containing protein n=1 Tax=Paracoccus luteus TaxID=2508543 RepID=UPI00106FE051|nr:YsnF/AvaK domain-containing protein [Paracoccus luteus]
MTDYDTFSTSGASRSLSAMFDNRAEADRAVAALAAAGIADVVLTGGDNAGYGAVERTGDARRDDNRGFFESIGDFFFPDEDRYSYAEGLGRGGYLVTVRNIPAAQYDTALDILDDEGAVDMDAREQEWRAEGWTGYDRDALDSGSLAAGGVGAGSLSADSLGAGSRVAGSMADDRTRLEGDTNADGVIDVVEERVMIAKRETEGGRVRVRSYVTETPVEQDVELRTERVNVERRPVDRPAGDAAFADRTLEAREYSETPVVHKEARVVEEIALNKDVETRVETVRDSVRKTEVEIEDDRGTLTGRDDDLTRR